MKKNKLDDSLSAYSKSFPYELDNSLMLQWYPKRVVSRMKKGSLLELGLGHGYTCKEFSSHVSSYTILDGSPAIIEKFKSENPELNYINIVESYFEHYEPVEQFDNIVMGFILEHVEDPKLILSKYKDMLKPDGKLFISVPNASSLHRQLAHVAGMMPDIYALSKADKELGHVRYFDVELLCSMVEESGLKVENVEGLLLKPFTTNQMLSLNLDDRIYQALLEKGVDYPELSTGILLEASIK